MADIRYSTETPSNWPHPTKEGLQRRVGKLQKRLEHAKHMMRQKSDEIHAFRRDRPTAYLTIPAVVPTFVTPGQAPSEAKSERPITGIPGRRFEWVVTR
jgi:hypothetical protein